MKYRGVKVHRYKRTEVQRRKRRKGFLSFGIIGKEGDSEVLDNQLAFLHSRRMNKRVTCPHIFSFNFGLSSQLFGLLMHPVKVC